MRTQQIRDTYLARFVFTDFLAHEHKLYKYRNRSGNNVTEKMETSSKCKSIRKNHEGIR